MVAGRIKKILIPEGTTRTLDSGLVTIRVFELGQHLHPDFEMPILTCSTPDRFHTVKSLVSGPIHSSVYGDWRIDTALKNLQFLFSAEHDCRMARCLPTALRRQVQERQETAQTTKMICHEDDKHFVVNTHALHNANLLRKFLPRNITAPKPLYDDREAGHHEIAVTLRVTQAEKRARTAAKRKATQDAKKNKARPTEVEQPESEDSHNEGSEGGETPVASTSRIAEETRAGKRRRV
jgi:hypothetical protein